MFLRRSVAVVLALAFALFAPAWWCGWEADDWFAGDVDQQTGLADWLVAFEKRDDLQRASAPGNHFVGEWALVTHQMTALGLAQIVLAHPELGERYAPIATASAAKSFLPEMRDFGTRAWSGEDALVGLNRPHGHAYLAYPALAVGMARLVDPAFPADLAAAHDALIAAYERRLLSSPTGLIETYPGQAYPTDVAAVAAAIAVHGRATGTRHDAVLRHWARAVERVQIDPRSGFVFQRMNARTGKPSDAPRGSGTGLAAYYAGFANRALAERLARSLLEHRRSLLGFSAIQEYAAGHQGAGDVDSGPVLFGVSVAATGFALAPARAFGYREEFVGLVRTVDLFGMPLGFRERRFATGGPIGNALLLAFLTSGPELAP